jgi:pilus assembly protein CpaE
LILDALARIYDYVIIDMGSTLQDMELSIFDLADRVVLVGAPDVPSVKDISLFFDLMEALEYPTDKFLLVLNKANSAGSGVTAKLMENNLKKSVFAQIPYDGRIVMQSVNQGVPYMIFPSMDKRSPLYQQTEAFGGLMLQQFEAEETDQDQEDQASGRLSSGRLF